MKIIALEGLDGAGKSTAAAWLGDWLSRRGLRFTVERLYHRGLLSRQFDALNRCDLIGAREASLMTAAELAGRLHALTASQSLDVMIWDKYVGGSVARDRSRDVADAQLHALYAELPPAELNLFLAIDPPTALERKRASGGPKLWESGLDLSLGLKVHEIEGRLAANEIPATVLDAHFLEFQARIQTEYQRLFDERWRAIDASRSTDEMRRELLRIVGTFFEER